MKRLHQYGLIVLLGTAYAVIFNDYFLPLIVVLTILLLAIVLDGVRDYKQRRNEKMLDRRGMMKEVMQEANKLKSEGKAATQKDALKLVKSTGTWDRLLQKFRRDDTQVKKTKEEKKMENKTAKEKFPWAFNTKEDDATSGITVEVANEKGHEYAALIRVILDEGTTDWKGRINDLDTLQAEMEEIVANLKKSYEELKQERALVTHLAKLKSKEQLE